MKNDILRILDQHRGEFVSGSTLSEMLGVSRTAVWKQINALRTSGYAIESVSRRGHRLLESPSDLGTYEIGQFIEESHFLKEGIFLETVDSTNAEAKRIATDANFEERLPLIVIARDQNAGRGRLGRAWTSEPDSGIWCTLLMKPALPPEAAAPFTLIAAAAMCEAIESETGLDVGIKWPNDLIASGKKLCGILTELGAETDRIHYLVIGIGVNVSQTSFPGELTEKATSIQLETGLETINRLNILKAFVERFEIYYNLFVNQKEICAVIAYNRKKSVTLNREVVIGAGQGEAIAYAEQIDESGNLIVRYGDGRRETIYYGEVSVRGINGYA